MGVGNRRRVREEECTLLRTQFVDRHKRGVDMREKGGWMFPGKHWLLGKGRKRDMAGSGRAFKLEKSYLPTTYLRFPYISSRGGREGGIMVGEGGWFFRPYARAQRIAGKYISIQGEIRCWTGREIYYTVVDIALTRHGDDGLPRADLLLEPSLSLGDGDAAADEAGRHQVQHVVPAHREVELAGPALERQKKLIIYAGEKCLCDFCAMCHDFLSNCWQERKGNPRCHRQSLPSTTPTGGEKN